MDNNICCRERAVPSRCLEPIENQESHEVQEYGNGCCHVQKKVLLKGFGEVVKSKRCRRMAIKLLISFLSTSGFLYQTWAFLEMYLAYPTTLDTSEEYPDSFIEPALTICSRNRIWRQPYCKTYPENCTWEHTTWESFCDSHRRMCPEIKPPDFNFGEHTVGTSFRDWQAAITLWYLNQQAGHTTVLTRLIMSQQIPVSKILDVQNESNAFLNAVGPQKDSNTIYICERFENSSFTPCNSYSTVIQVSRNGFPYKCFSLFSLLLNPYEEPSTLNLTNVYSVWFDMHPEELFNTIEPVEAILVFHDPRKAVNPMTEGIPLTSGKLYYLYPTMERRESLPPPYASNCMDYLNEWKKNGGSGPLSKDDCIDNCKIKAMVDEYGCVGKSMTYPNDFPICENIDIRPSSEVNKKCASRCQDACEENIYHVTSDTVLDFRTKYKAEDEHSRRLRIAGLAGSEFPPLYEPPMDNRTTKNQEKYTKIAITELLYRAIFPKEDLLAKAKNMHKEFGSISIELFSYIGGYLGMWLGISLAAVFDLGEMLYDVKDSAFLKRKRNQKTTTPIEKF